MNHDGNVGNTGLTQYYDHVGAVWPSQHFLLSPDLNYNHDT